MPNGEEHRYSKPENSKNKSDEKSKKEKAETTRLNAEIPSPVHKRFKAKTALEGRKMTEVVRELIREYVSE